MERIKKALELARREREAAGAGKSDTLVRPKELANETWHTEGRVRAITEGQVKAIEVSEEECEKNRLLLKRSQSDETTTAYKVLRTQVLQRMQENGWNSLAVTGPALGAGKSLTTINLAISVAEKVNHSVVLIDLDLRRPSIHRYLGYTPEYGISEYLQDDVPLQDILITPGIDRLLVLPGNRPITNPSEMISSPKMLKLLDELKTRDSSRLVLCDLPPVLVSDDLLAFSPHIDAVLLVIEDAKTTRDEITRTLELIKGTQLLGTVLNKSDEKPLGGYGYYNVRAA